MIRLVLLYVPCTRNVLNLLSLLLFLLYLIIFEYLILFSKFLFLHFLLLALVSFTYEN